MPRSNKWVTEKIACYLDDYCNFPDCMQFAWKGLTVESDAQYFIVKIFGNEVYRLYMREGSPDSIRVTNGFYLDGYGLPTRQTREVVNGLLDVSGELGLIPSGVRVFKDGTGYAVGKGEYMAPLDKENPFRFLRFNKAKESFSIS